MSEFKLNITLFGGGGDAAATAETAAETATGSWTEGVTKSAIENTLAQFDEKIQAAVDAINNFGPVETALEEGWSGQDRVDYVEKFHQHAKNVIAEIEEYKSALHKTVDEVIAQWESFQQSLIS